MFLAIFFVSVGMLIDPAQIAAHWPIALTLSLLVLFGKVFGVALGAVLTGSDTRTALRVGLSLAQIGEFSFIIAALGAGSGVADESCYPLIVGVAGVGSSPILIARSDRIADAIERLLPRRLSTFASLYGSWLEELRQHSSRDTRWKSVRRTLFRVGIDMLLFIGLLITGTLVESRLAERLGDSAGLAPGLARAVVLLGFAMVCLWPLLGMVRGARRLGAALAEMALPSRKGSMDAAQTPRRALSAGLQVAVLLVIALPTLALTEPFLPGFASVGLLALLSLLLISMIWRSSADLDGHMRAGAELVLEALAKSGGVPSARMDQVNELLPGVGEVHSLQVQEGHPSIGQTLHEAGLGSGCGISVVAIQRGAARLILPGGNERLQARDMLAITGSEESVQSALSRWEGSALPRE
jgi:CPA2 family monovalent cation:H+ antiporter-2